MPKQKLFNYKVIKNKLAREPYHWVCVAGNGEIRFTSENYTQKHSAINAVAADMKYRVRGVSSFEDLTDESENIPKRIKAILARR